ncbi:hypothetical protein AMTR_s00001p00125420 [Amborella trichopoda]|uniref:DUF1990 domain-containing protein n=1 Tax=Amborella trichopoda TaxID=13333 RepID=W1NL78_AMBTC|nr:hypothetical protein AMTR_s00001p00125420 [Amborella trichopoda]
MGMCGTFNYDPKFHGATGDASSDIHEFSQRLASDGFAVNHARILLGYGLQTYDKAVQALQNWRHFQLNWALVDPKTRIKTGERFCVCTKEFLPWVLLPLEIIYVRDPKGVDLGPKLKHSFRFGSGTLHGHLLAGEERFSIEWDEENKVWYEILSFSKPSHILSFMSYPYVSFRQKQFAKQSMQAVLEHLSAQHPREM